ncbi:MAG: 50S ribosomal protein L29 [Flavobacteriales bacterium]|nr:50S ribosomal protein L29 [Flavobacteriales bacterium]
MKPSEIRELGTEEVRERLEITEETMVKMKLNHAVSPLENPMTLKDNRRTIARLQTELTKRALEEAKNNKA